MPELDDYFRMVASEFDTAIVHFKDVEDTLLDLEVKLENCLERLKKLARDESLPVDQPDIVVYKSRPSDTRLLRPVDPRKAVIGKISSHSIG